MTIQAFVNSDIRLRAGSRRGQTGPSSSSLRASPKQVDVVPAGAQIPRTPAGAIGRDRTRSIAGKLVVALPRPTPKQLDLASRGTDIPRTPSGARGRDRVRTIAASPVVAAPSFARGVGGASGPDAAAQSPRQNGPATPSRPKPDYSVGYKKPPLHTRWPDKYCPNPKGRPRGSKDTATLVTKALDERVPVTENGRRRMMSKRQLAIKKAVNRATESGDINALLKLVALEIRTAPPQFPDAVAAPKAELSRSDQEVLQWYLSVAGGSHELPPAITNSENVQGDV